MLVPTITTLREVVHDAALQRSPTDIAHDALANAIRQTIIFFDLFDFPLTAWEVYKYLWREGVMPEVGFFAVQQALAQGVPGIVVREGLYLCAGREELIVVRQTRAAIAAVKYRRARRIGWVLSLCPFTRLVAVSNSLAYDNVHEDSDIDFFVVTSAGHLWTARLVTAGLLKLFRLRPTATRKRNTICLNFFVSEDGLNLETLRKSGSTPDVYLTYWVRQLMPLYDAGNVMARVTQANAWTSAYVGGSEVCVPSLRRRLCHGMVARAVKRLGELVMSARGIEHLLKQIQWRKLPRHIRVAANRSTDVVLTDRVLKFHDKDRRDEYREEWRRRVKSKK